MEIDQLYLRILYILYEKSKSLSTWQIFNAYKKKYGEFEDKEGKKKHMYHKFHYRIKNLSEEGVLKTQDGTRGALYNLHQDKVIFPNGSVVYLANLNGEIRSIILGCRYAEDCEHFKSKDPCPSGCKLDQDLTDFLNNFHQKDEKEKPTEANRS